jgi:hypothetical protein
MFKAILGGLLTLPLLTGCSLVSINSPVGTSGGALFQSQNYGGKDGSSKAEMHMESSDKYHIVGPVSTKGNASSILGLVGFGNTGYGLLVEKARDMGADDVINLYADTHHTSVLLGLYTSSTVTYYGTAIKYLNQRNLDVEVMKGRR